MNEKDGKAAKKRFSQAHRSHGEGRCQRGVSGLLVRRWLPVTFKSDFS